MPEINTKINNRDNLLSPQNRSVRSRKSKSLSEETVLTDDDGTILSQKDTEDDTGAVAVPQQHPLQECVIIKQHHQAEKLACLPDQDGLTKEKGTKMTSINIANVAVTGREDTDPSSDFQLETCGVNTETDTKKNKENKEEAASEGCNKSPHQTSTDRLQVSKEDDESAVLKKIYAKKNLNSEKNQDKPSTCASDAIESTAGLPAKKKRRMSTCDLSEKEWSHSSQIQMRENGQNGTDSAEKQIYNKTPKSVVLEKETPSASTSPQHVSADCITEQSEAKPMPQSSHHRAETEVQIAVATSDGTSIFCDPDSLEGKTSEAERVSPPGPELTDDPESHQLAEENEKHLESQQLQEHKETAAENSAEIPEKQMKTGESAGVNLRSTVTSQMDESDNKDATEADVLQMNNENETGDEKKGCMTDDCVKKAVSSADTQTGSLSCGVRTLCEARLTHSVQESDPKDDCVPGSSAGCTRHEGPDDRFGFRCPDYVSDSQLNTIILVDDKMMEKDESDLSVCLEDATDRIHGLIGELSSLNRKVMVAHRQLENLHRKNPKRFAR